MQRFAVFSGVILLISAWILLSFDGSEQANAGSVKRFPVSWNQKPEDIKTGCAKAKKNFLQTMDKIAALPLDQLKFDNSMRQFESAISQYVYVTDPLTFHKYVSTNADLRKAADDCEKDVSKVFVDIFTRKDLYSVLNAFNQTKPKLNADDQKLTAEHLDEFERNGLKLSDKDRKKFITIKKQLVDIKAEFRTRLNEWKNPLPVSKAELGGMPDDFIEGLEKTKDGKKYILTLKYPHYYPFMKNGKNAETRKRLEKLFMTRGGEHNRELLKQAVKLRYQMAKLLGYETHAHFKLAKKMAKDPTTVNSFLSKLQKQLKSKGKDDMRQLLALKQKELKDPKIDTLDSWDWRYYANQLEKEKYQVDQQKLKEYFPLNRVLKGMFDIYQTLLDVQYVEVVDAPKWHDSISCYAVIDPKTNEVISYFYMDLFPREGKYGHAAAFTLVSGQKLADGAYRKPVSSIVANFNAPIGNNPSLLLHDQVETLFHEFGHIMHQVLTKATYRRFSGTSVKRDFVEAPSQMLENWVWKKDSLVKMSGHYKTGKPLPDQSIAKLTAAKNANAGIRYLRQVFFATLDMNYYSQTSEKTVDTTKVYRKLMAEVFGLPPQKGTYPEASFGHLMSGYDAGYYGYLWSEVYAADMFTRFEKEGLLNTKTGRDYRTWILEPGGSTDPFKLLQKFIGRKPNQQAFLRELGIETKSSAQQKS